MDDNNLERLKELRELRERVDVFREDIERLEYELRNAEIKLRELEGLLSDDDKEALASEARGKAWIKRVIKYTGKHPRDLPPAEWFVPLTGLYLGGAEKERKSPRAIILRIRPDGSEKCDDL